MKKYWLAITIQENGKYYSYALPILEYDNLFPKLTGIPGIYTANFCSTKKEARSLVEEWNKQYKTNSIYLFDTMPDGSPAPF